MAGNFVIDDKTSDQIDSDEIDYDKINPFEAISRIIDNGRNSFTFLINEALGKQNINESICSSPLSLQIVLALAYTGATGYTAKEIANLLKLPKGEREFLDGYAAVVKVLKDPALNIASAIFVESSFIVRKEFNDKALKYFKSEVKFVHFEEDPMIATTVINSWVEKQTKYKIKGIIAQRSLSSSTVMILINAIHFKANWKYPFQQEHTQKESFYLSRTNTVDLDMMHMHGEFRCLEHLGLNAKILELPYKGNTFSMFIVLPDEIEGLGVMEEKLKHTDLLHELKKMTKRKVNVSIPKFEISETFNLNDTLTSLGVVKMFDRRAADFYNISPREIYVSEVIQKTFIRVDEMGTEAAAASAIEMVNTSSRSPETVFEFTADHPFIFIISKALSNNRFLLIFVGRYFAR